MRNSSKLSRRATRDGLAVHGAWARLRALWNEGGHLSHVAHLAHQPCVQGTIHERLAQKQAW